MQQEHIGHIDFAIITIRVDEYQAVAQRFHTDPRRGKTSGRTYSIGSIQTKDRQNRTVAVARSTQPGPQAAQQVARDMIADLSPSLLLVVGIAGGVPDTDFTLGDVVVSSHIHDFGVNAYKPDEIQWSAHGGLHPDVDEIVASLPMRNDRLKDWNSQASISVLRPILDITKFKDFDLARMTDEDIQRIFDGEQEKSWQQTILETLKWHFDDTSPQRSAQPLYTIGDIASSGSLVRDTRILVQWLMNARSIRAIEMESGGVFQAAQQLRQNQYPVIAIRGISDIVGLKRDPRWTAYACHSAAAFTYALLTFDSTIFDNIRPQDPDPLPPEEPPLPPSPKPLYEEDAPIHVYISYAKKDQRLKEELETHLSSLKNRKIISTWDRHTADLGTEKNTEIANHINAAHIVLLLVSPDFIDSHGDCYQLEMKPALKLQSSHVRIIPILIRYVNWQREPFSTLQILPRNGTPVDDWRSHDQAWYEIAKEIEIVCNKLLTR